MRAQLLRILSGSMRTVPHYSWSAFHPKVRINARHSVESLKVSVAPRINFVQAHVLPSRLQQTLMGWGVAVALGSAVYQFMTNLHSVPISGRTQVVAISQEEELELGVTAAKEGLQGAQLITSGPRARMCLDVVSRLVSVSEHLFPREYDWTIWLVDAPNVANACCYPGGKIIIYTGLLDAIDRAVERGHVSNKHDALAVIVAHEIGHALARHAAERMSYLPILYMQTVLGYESPLLQYFFQFAMNLPFSRVQEMEADHIGIMLMASACYDPTTAPKFWKCFGAATKADGEEDDEDLDLDFFSTHPSHKKRERRLESLVEEALVLQQQASWCFQVKERVLQMVRGEAPDSAFLQRVQSFQQQQGTKDAQVTRRRNTVGTLHELENQEIIKGIRIEKERKRAMSVDAAAATGTVIPVGAGK